MAANSPMLDLFQNCQVWPDLELDHATHGRKEGECYRAQWGHPPGCATTIGLQTGHRRHSSSPVTREGLLVPDRKQKMA